MRDEFKLSALPYLCLKAGIPKAVRLGRAGVFLLESKMGFTKLDSGIIDSSIWEEPLATRVVWVTFLAKADRNGFVGASLSGMKRASNVPPEDFNLAVKTLETPDSDSRSKEFEGRRIEKVEGGWQILNYIKYRQFSYSDSKEAIKKRKQRERNKGHSGGTQGDTSRLSRDISASASVLDINRSINKRRIKGVVNGGTQKITLILDEEPKRWEGITPELKALWAKSYPGCDIDTVLQEMIAYWDAQPKAKRKINWKVTIVNRLKWLQDHGGTRGGVTGGVMEWLAKEKEKEKLNE